MTTLPLKALLNVGVNLEIATKKSSVRKRVNTSSLKQDGLLEDKFSGMVPKIAVVSHDVENLDDDSDNRRHVTKTWMEEEDLSDGPSVNGSKQNAFEENDHIGVSSRSHVLNGGVYQPPTNSDQLFPLLEEHGDDGFKTEVAGKGYTGSEEEGSFTIGLQVFLPFLVAGFGMVLAGLLLDVVQVKTFTSYGMEWFRFK